MPDLIVQDLVKEFPTPGEPLRILDGINLSISRGESLSIIGPSGSGKSTLLAILGSLEPPTSGSVQLAGQNPFTLSETELAKFRSEQIGFVFQEHHLLPQCTALENVLVPFLADGANSKESLEYAKELLDRVGLADRLTHQPAELSGGERQRVAISRALVRRPTLVLADEPTGNLDRAATENVADILAGLLSDREAILLIATHSDALAEIAQRKMKIDTGRLIER